MISVVMTHCLFFLECLSYLGLSVHVVIQAVNLSSSRLVRGRPKSNHNVSLSSLKIVREAYTILLPA